MSVSYVARRHGIAPSQLFTRKRRMLEGGLRAVAADEEVVGTSRVRELERRTRELERLLGRETLEVEILKEALDAARVKETDLAARVVARSGGRLPMKAVADTLGVARSNPVERRARPPGTRGRYRKPGDALLLPLIRRLVDDERPSYGYRRITALLSRHRRAHGGPSVNAKRVLRIMQVNGLTLERHTARRPGRTHDGVVVALRPDVRWSSDHFEPACRNGEVVRVLLAIDACDREVIAWSAATGGVSGEMVRDLMIACVERPLRRHPHRASGRVALRQRQRLHRQGCESAAKRDPAVSL
jgi:transposase InsO family protein